jgi:hypothetical protein
MKGLIKLVLGFVTITVLQACATSTDLVNRSQVVVDLDRGSAIETMVEQAKTCWAQSYSFFSDAAVVEPNFDGLIVRRWAPDLGYEHTRPMFKVRILKKTSSSSTVIMDEGECGSLCVDDSFTADATRWLNGDLRCKEPK